MNGFKKDLSLLLLRLSVGGLMLFHGYHKLIYGVSGIEGALTARGIPAFLAFGVYIGEVVAPLMILLGYKAKIGGMLQAFTMLVAFMLVHTGDLFKVTSHGGWAIELLVLFLFGSIVISLLGSGAYSLSRGKGKWD